jgi:hypothetical protein
MDQITIRFLDPRATTKRDNAGVTTLQQLTQRSRLDRAKRTLTIFVD